MSEKPKVGVVNLETWDFFHEVFEHFSKEFETSVFEKRESSLPVFRGRADRYLLRRDMNRFLSQNDVVFFEWASDMLALATSLPKSAKIVTRLHRWELYHWADLVNWDAVDEIILVSQAKRKEFLERFPQQEAKIHVIPESVDLNRFQFTEREFSGSIGILCHLRPRKRVYELILTFAELHEQNESLRLHIGGNDVPEQQDYYQALLGLVEKMGLEDVVSFDGFQEQPSEWYRKIDILISNSYSEGLQVSPMEAMASGCYTLSHRWDGAEELLPEDCLYFTDSELRERIFAFCQLPAEAQGEQRRRLRAIVEEKFNIDVNKREIAKLVIGQVKA